MTYEFDVFLSYRETPQVIEWVRDSFFDLFCEELGNALGGRTARVFFDRAELKPADLFRSRVGNVLLVSRCLVPIWTPHYFHSPWCCAELETFRRRESLLGLKQRGLIAPIAVRGTSLFPAPYKEIQYADFSDVYWAGPAFRNSSRHLEFQQKLRKLADDVAAVIQGVPQFDPHWPIVMPETLTTPALPDVPFPRFVSTAA